MYNSAIEIWYSVIQLHCYDMATVPDDVEFQYGYHQLFSYFALQIAREPGR